MICDDHDRSAEDKGYVSELIACHSCSFLAVRISGSNMHRPKHCRVKMGKMGRPIDDCSQQRFERHRRSRVWQSGPNCWTEMGNHWNMKVFCARFMIYRYLFELVYRSKTVLCWKLENEDLTKSSRLEPLEDAKLL